MLDLILNKSYLQTSQVQIISLLSIQVKSVTTFYRLCPVTYQFYLVYPVVVALVFTFSATACIVCLVEILPWRPQVKKFHAWWAILVPATCSESTAAAAAGGAKIYACLLCHPENAGITAFRCERKHGGWWCWGWRGVWFVLCKLYKWSILIKEFWNFVMYSM